MRRRRRLRKIMSADYGDYHYHCINDKMNQSHYLKLEKKNGLLVCANNIISYLSILDLILYNFL